MKTRATTTRTTRILPASPEGIEAAAAILRGGGLVAFPTETVYGLGGDATRPDAVASIYAAKGRPQFNPLIAHIASVEEAGTVGVLDERAHQLMQRFWPGPLTLVVPAGPQSSVCELARAGLASVALRMPSHPVALGLIAALGHPLAGPSANRSGHVSPTCCAHVLADLDGEIDAVIDAGATTIGVESTILALTGDRAVLLRHGGVTREAIEAVIGPVDLHQGADVLAPGMLASHYAPRAALRLDVQAVRPGEALLAFGDEPPRNALLAKRTLNLSPSGDIAEAAANLYAHLRELDASGVESIAVAKIPHDGIGAAIADRLKRAAADKTG